MKEDGGSHQQLSGRTRRRDDEPAEMPALPGSIPGVRAPRSAAASGASPPPVGWSGWHHRPKGPHAWARKMHRMACARLRRSCGRCARGTALPPPAPGPRHRQPTQGGAGGGPAAPTRRCRRRSRDFPILPRSGAQTLLDPVASASCAPKNQEPKPEIQDFDPTKRDLGHRDGRADAIKRGGEGRRTGNKEETPSEAQDEHRDRENRPDGGGLTLPGPTAGGGRKGWSRRGNPSTSWWIR